MVKSEIHRSSKQLVRTLRSVVCATLGVLVFLALSVSPAHGSVALLLEESYGVFGALSPTGHAAVYLNHVCADSPTTLRVCRPGEFGVVISRYHKIDGYDWIAIPLIPYLYAVDDTAQAPASVNKAQVASLRDAYRRQNLEDIAPDTRRGNAPHGAWVQLVGSSYDRTIHGFEVETTPEQDMRFISIYNDRSDVSHFNLLFRNCADFSRTILNIYFPDAIHRNFIADLGLTTPKQVAKSLVAYSRKHTELQLTAFVIPQVPGTIKRSHSVDGITESLVKSKKYLIPLAILSPELTGGVIVAYLAAGRGKLPKANTIFNIEDAAVQPTRTVHTAATGSSQRHQLTAPVTAEPVDTETTAPDAAP